MDPSIMTSPRIQARAHPQLQATGPAAVLVGTLGHATHDSRGSAGRRELQHPGDDRVLWRPRLPSGRDYETCCPRHERVGESLAS